MFGTSGDCRDIGASLYNLSRPLHGHRSVLKKVDEHDPLFEDLADPIQVGRYHSWVIDPETMPGEIDYQLNR